MSVCVLVVKLDESLSKQPHSPGNSAEEGCNTLKECIISTAEAVVGRGKRKHQRAVKHAVDEAKERWILRVAREAESARRDGKRIWMSIRQLQMAYAG